MKEKIANSWITLDHLNLGLLILGGIIFIGISWLFIKHSTLILSRLSGLIKDPVTGQWSTKLAIALMAATVIFFAHLVWLKASFISNNFSQLENILLIDYGFITSALTLKTIEKMQAKKIDGTPETPKTDAPNT